MSQCSLQAAANEPDMDGAIPEEVAITQNATASRATAVPSNKGRGRGRWTRPRNTKVTKPAQQKAPSGRGRRQKVYENPRVQAAHERTQELKQAFLAISKLVKPAAQEVADRSINELLEDPALYKQVPQYGATKKFLRDRHDETIQQCNDRLEHGLAMAEHVWQAQHQKVMEEYTTKVAELCEDRYGQLLRQLDILETLYENGLPADEITQEDADCQGVFRETEGGVEVPHSGKTISQLMVKPQTLPLEPKRKADGQPEGLPAAKVAAVAKGDETAPQMPRHPAGLLGAADAIEESGATTSDSGSGAPTPTPVPEPAEEAAPEPVNQRVVSGVATPDDGPELPIPRGATDPDEFGVRLISRRPTRMDIPNNRIMVPNLFEWDDLDIGFRDSTNCVQKGATKQRRGKYLGRPGSNCMFIDRRAGIWDSTLAAGELDDDLVKKHKLHPTLGITLPDSVNEWEAPKPTANGWKSVVFVPPSGDPIHASRTIEAARMDAETEVAERRMRIVRLVRTACEQEDISQEDVAPDAELVEKNRIEVLVARGLDPAQVVQVAQPEPSSPTPEPAVEDTLLFDQFATDALGAAAALEAVEEAARMAAAKRAQQPRPYDAIRDVFTESPSTRQPSPPTAQETPLPAPPMAADTSGLSYLADLALQPEPPAMQPAATEQPHHGQPPLETMMALGEYDHQQAEYARSAEYPPPDPAHFARQDGPSAPMEPVRTNDFLRTALNPQPASPPLHMSSVQEYGGVPLAPAHGPMTNQGPQSSAGRTPFSSTGAAKALPALRPMRSLLNETPAFQEPQGNPALHHNMVPSNSGAYFPPAANRPFHNSYSVQGQPQPMQSMMPQMQLGNPHQPPSHACPPMGPAPIRRMSTPPPYHQPANPPLGPAPGSALGSQAPIHYQGGQQPLAPAGSSAPRSRPGSSSAANSAAASKYRKLEPAPTPPHRLSYSGNGQELRTVQFDYREAIKDYSAVEAPPRHGPTQIRGWTHNNIRKRAGGGGGASSGGSPANKKSGDRKRTREDPNEGPPGKRVKTAGPSFAPISGHGHGFTAASQAPSSLPPSRFVPIAPRVENHARLPTPTSASATVPTPPMGHFPPVSAANTNPAVTHNQPTPKSDVKKPRTRAATRAPRARSPYNLRSRGGAQNTGTNTNPSP
ncbi:hypothetical protein CHGG_03207 [Chaetomium globosum CBS 148.51]|uniref:Uncharacterized protein n=1 Tax=Chaetomium globosum (strain ATCC 6205 / CBS 148.51 / DSM 1962 / NBRC 6347 / NRRL 1970) TaxID=306901 RepID=Q2H997_CHAGB|nr:uncharacterized protein CHGG_03207 [Chaetomium globosum CBS 148.51]EAQ91272.1 hypothetical protein CHGG_03207 [Chaetomium globosum CBS 148.51]